MIDEFLPFGSRHYIALLAVLILARGMDFLSTWVATPNLVLEANPIAKRLGWKWGALLNVAICAFFAVWPLPAIVLITTSLLVAARNFQSAWLMRSLGEESYRSWIAERIAQSSLPLHVFCLMSQTLLTAAIGGVLMLFSEWRLVPFSVGMGIVTYAVAVTFYTLLSLWRQRRAAG
ncbi:MAG: hypothetical protein HYY24_14445 [Verrucomicrobia bacterium]|nr:hypothetical protein [Verrucomicrobiota bacterium]